MYAIKLKKWENLPIQDIMKLFIPILIFSFTSLSYGKRFSTTYVSFELLNNWHCYPEGTEWICSNKLNRSKASEAVIILTAKEKGPADNLPQYLKHLKTPREVSDKKGNNIKSKVFHTKQRQIHNHLWVDGFHQGSEVPSYHTRYLITTKDKMAVLVTYSAHKNHYTKYASDFSKSISSLRLHNTGKFSGLGGGKGRKMGAGSFQNYLEDMIDPEGELVGDEEVADSEGLKDLLSDPMVLGGALGGAGLLSYLLFKRRRRGGGSLPGGGDRDSERNSRRRRRSSSRRH